MITLGLALFDNNNRLITLRGGYKDLHYLTKFIVTVQPAMKLVIAGRPIYPFHCLGTWTEN
jgi:hypothetical protein